MVKITTAGKTASGMFPYVVDLSCRNCGLSFELEEGDNHPWTRVVCAPHEFDFVFTPCPNPACDAYVAKANDNNLPWSRPVGNPLRGVVAAPVSAGRVGRRERPSLEERIAAREEREPDDDDTAPEEPLSQPDNPAPKRGRGRRPVRPDNRPYEERTGIVEERLGRAGTKQI